MRGDRVYATGLVPILRLLIQICEYVERNWWEEEIVCSTYDGKTFICKKYHFYWTRRNSSWEMFRLDLFQCWNHFNIIWYIYIYIRIRIEGKKIFMTSFLLVKREKESLKIMVNISFQSIKSCTIKKWWFYF